MARCVDNKSLTSLTKQTKPPQTHYIRQMHKTKAPALMEFQQGLPSQCDLLNQEERTSITNVVSASSTPCCGDMLAAEAQAGSSTPYTQDNSPIILGK